MKSFSKAVLSGIGVVLVLTAPAFVQGDRSKV